MGVTLILLLYTHDNKVYYLYYPYKRGVVYGTFTLTLSVSAIISFSALVIVAVALFVHVMGHVAKDAIISIATTTAMTPAFVTSIATQILYLHRNLS